MAATIGESAIAQCRRVGRAAWHTYSYVWYVVRPTAHLATAKVNSKTIDQWKEANRGVENLIGWRLFNRKSIGYKIFMQGARHGNGAKGDKNLERCIQL